MKKKRNPPTQTERRLVFLAYRDVFAKDNAHARTDKSIRSVALEHWPSNKSLVDGCAFHKVVEILKHLVSTGGFESEVQVGKVEQWGPAVAIGALGKREALFERPIKTESEETNDDTEHQDRGIFSSMPFSILLTGDHTNLYA